MPAFELEKISDLPPALSVLGTMLMEQETAEGESVQVTNSQFFNWIKAGLAGAAPSTLDAFDEVAAALGNDPNFATTMMAALGGKVAKAGDTLTGALNFAATVDIASAATTDIGAVNSNLVRITGANAISALGVINAGAIRFVRFAAALTLTHNAVSLILPGNADILTEANDTAVFVSLGGGNWRLWFYQRAADAPAGTWRTWAPTVSSTVPAGSGLTYTVVYARYSRTGKTVTAQMQVLITNLGSGPSASGNGTITLPFNAATAAVANGYESGVSGLGMTGRVDAGSNVLTLRLTSGAATMVLNQRWWVSITYEAA